MTTLESAFLASLAGTLDRAANIAPAEILCRPGLDPHPDPGERERWVSERVSALLRAEVPSCDVSPDAVPPGFPLPLTVGAAVRLARPELPRIAAALAAEAERVARTFAGDLAPLVLADPRLVPEWPLPSLDWPSARAIDAGIGVPPEGPAYVSALVALRYLASAVRYREARRVGRSPSPWDFFGSGAMGLPDEVSPDAFAAWIKPRLSGVDRGVAVRLVSRESGGLPRSFVTVTSNGARWPIRGIALVYLAMSGSHAAGAAFAAARELVAERDGLPDAFGAAVRSALVKADDPLARELLGDVRALAGYAADLRERARGIVTRVLGEAPPDPIEDCAGPLAWDLHLAAELGRLGEAGKERAAGVRASAAERAAEVSSGRALPPSLWRLWSSADGAPRWLHALARVLWADTWGPAIVRERSEARERARERVAAYPVAVVDTLRNALSAVEIRENDDRAELLGRDGRHLAYLAPRGLPGALTAALPTVGELTSVDTHRFLLWFLRAVRAQVVDEVPDPRVLRIEGRWPALAELVGADREVLSRVVPFLARLPIPGPTELAEPGNLYVFDPGALSRGQRRGWLALTAGTQLLPAAVKARAEWDRSTLPIPDLPPMAGVLTNRGNESGRLATLRLLTVRRLEAAGAELVEEGGALISGADWLRDLNDVGLTHPIARVDRLVDAWTRDGDDGRAFLVEVERPTGGRPGRYHLHPEHHSAARDFLDHGARMSSEGRARAKKHGRKGRK